MSKSVLVIDTPSSCRECKLKCDKYQESKLCAATKIYVDSYYDDNSKPDWCPLSPIPEKQVHNAIDNTFQRGSKSGYNYCIEEILKGEK